MFCRNVDGVFCVFAFTPFLPPSSNFGIIFPGFVYLEMCFVRLVVFFFFVSYSIKSLKAAF